MVNEELLTLAELSERSGVEARTLRSWIAQGVVPGAETAGRNARYAPAALIRARAARAMRELYGMSLPDIRKDMLTADDAKIEAYAALAGSTPEAAPDVATQAASPGAPAGTSAADYLTRLRSAGVFGADHSKAATPPPASVRMNAFAPAVQSAPPPASRIARLAEALEQIAGTRPSRRKAKGEVRLHIPITPELEFTVRGDHTPEEIARYEQIADLLRAILTGGFEP